jgi:hypothetical protein
MAADQLLIIYGFGSGSSVYQKFGPGSFKAQNAAFFQTKKQCDIRLEFCINFKNIYPP